MKYVFYIIAVPVLVYLVASVFSSQKKELVYGKVIELQQQQLIKGGKDNMSTEIRYLVITDKETFICESSWLNGKFNNSDIFWHLKKDSTYQFEVCGFGKYLFFDYRNILESSEALQKR